MVPMREQDVHAHTDVVAFFEYFASRLVEFTEAETVDMEDTNVSTDSTALGGNFDAHHHSCDP